MLRNEEPTQLNLVMTAFFCVKMMTHFLQNFEVLPCIFLRMSNNLVVVRRERVIFSLRGWI